MKQPQEQSKDIIHLINDNDLFDFQQYLLAAKGYSEKTALNYGRDAASFLLFLKKHNLNRAMVERDTLNLFLVEMRREGIQASSIKRRLSGCRAFYRYLVAAKGYVTNPFEMLRSPKQTKKLPRFLSYQEVCQFLDGNKERKDSLRDRDQAVLELLFASGLRASELIHLKLQDVDRKMRLMRVLGKGKKERIVPFSKTADAALGVYLSEIRPLLLPNPENDEGYVFLNSRGGKLTERGLEYLVTEAAQKSGFTLKVHPHMLRHSFATELLNNGMDLREIQELLGHASIKTTSVYTHVSFEDLKETYQKCFPKAYNTRSDLQMNGQRAVIFDFNGTMFFDEEKHVISWRRFAKEKFGVEIADEDFPKHIHGHNNDDILTFLAGHEFTKAEVAKLAEEKELCYQRICEEDEEHLHLVDGLPEFLDRLCAHGIKIGIATASMKPNVDWYLRTFHLEKWFPLNQIVYDDGTLTKGKPHPMIYERALRALGVSGNETIVFEDSVSGIKSAYGAKVRMLIAVEEEERRKRVEQMKEVHEIIPDFRTIPDDVTSFLRIQEE